MTRWFLALLTGLLFLNSSLVQASVLKDLLELNQGDCNVRVESENLSLIQIDANSINANAGESLQIYLPFFNYTPTAFGWVLEREIELKTKNYHPYFPRWTYASEILTVEYHSLEHRLVVRSTPAVIAPWRSFRFACRLK